MSSSLAGYTCVYCGTWVGTGNVHWCEKMHPNWSPEWSRLPALDVRVTDALERITAHLVELTEIVHKIAEKLEASNQESERRA